MYDWSCHNIRCLGFMRTPAGGAPRIRVRLHFELELEAHDERSKDVFAHTPVPAKLQHPPQRPTVPLSRPTKGALERLLVVPVEEALVFVYLFDSVLWARRWGVAVMMVGGVKGREKR